jgi:hypothetical protein
METYFIKDKKMARAKTDCLTQKTSMEISLMKQHKRYAQGVR